MGRVEKRQLGITQQSYNETVITYEEQRRVQLWFQDHITELRNWR